MRFKRPDLSNPNVRFRVMLYAGAVAIFGLLFIAAVFPLASNPTFCGVACHSQNPEFSSWKKSSHSKVTCYACHVNPTYTHLLKEKLIAGPMGIIGEITGNFEKPINAESHVSQATIPSIRCERCHANENRKFTFTRGIYMNHTAHKEAGVACTVCHNRIAHKGAEEFEPLKSWPEAKEVAEEEGHEKFEYKDFLKMKEGCFRCHSGSPDSRNQETLHLIENGKKAPTTCDTCHTSDFKLPEGHGEKSWRSGHGEVAKKDFDACLSCHDAGAKFDNNGEAWCTLCHDAAKVGQFKQSQAEAGQEQSPAEHEPAVAEESAVVEH